MNTVTTTAETRAENERRALLAALAEVRRCFPGTKPAPRKSRAQVAAGRGAAAEAAALATVVERFGLSAFERGVLLLCAGVELEAEFARAVAAAGGGGEPTFGLALAILPQPHWSALAPTAALRRWRLVDLGAGGVTSAPLRIDERVLHYLAGVDYPEPRLRGWTTPVAPPGGALPPGQAAAARALVETWSGAGGPAQAPLVVLVGDDATGHEAATAAAAAALGLRLRRLRAADLPAAPEERVALARLWEREAMLELAALLVRLDPDDPPEVAARAREWVEEAVGLIVVSAAEAPDTRTRPARTIALERPGEAERVALWRRELGTAAPELNGAVERVAAQFALDAPAIRRAARVAQGPAGRGGAALAERLWDASRTEARSAMEGLAQRLEPTAAWDDLVLPPAQRETLRTIVAQVRQRARVWTQWGFAARQPRGLGLHALFAGPSGTGKTLAAEVLARELRLDLHRIDLSALVSKFIGETEKNLRRVFDAAERGGSVLLFDEADALFGRRSEVKDSHDRYANIEVSYLLQRLESYCGLAILTTNLKSALDPAFARRLRFTVHFAFPDEPQRREIWARAFPEETPTEGLDLGRLARLSLAGGHIRNVALNAAFLAADENAPVRMRHLRAAAISEFAKLEKPWVETEVAGWD